MRTYSFFGHLPATKGNKWMSKVVEISSNSYLVKENYFQFIFFGDEQEQERGHFSAPHPPPPDDILLGKQFQKIINLLFQSLLFAVIIAAGRGRFNLFLLPVLSQNIST